MTIQPAAWPFARAVSALVVAGDVPTPSVQTFDDVPVAPDVLAEPVDDQHVAARRRTRPVAHLQRQAVARLQGGVHAPPFRQALNRSAPLRAKRTLIFGVACALAGGIIATGRIAGFRVRHSCGS